MDKNIVSNVMIIGGSLYLIQLVKLYTESGNSNLLINLLLVGGYFILLRVMTKSTQKNIDNLTMMVEAEDNIPRTFVSSLKLKISQLKAFKQYIIAFYCI